LEENRLRAFLHCSRGWSGALDETELFHMAAKALQDVADVDSGFFVYTKKSMEGFTPANSTMHASWGVFSNIDESLKSLVLDDVLNRHDEGDPLLERWTRVEDMPNALQVMPRHLGLFEIGIWPLDCKGQRVGAVIVARTHIPPAPLCCATPTTLMDVCAAQVSLALDFLLAVQIADKASQQDALTGLLNRRGLEARLPHLLQECERTGSHLVLGLLDVDNLKRVNDIYGHWAGDEALREIANLLCRIVRSGDLVARMGGDEFVVVLQTDKPDAYAAMARIQEAINSATDSLSLSLGGAVWQTTEGDSLESCLKVADARMYEQKRRKKTDQSQFFARYERAQNS
jgi:diguanylate cyclase (GGDEF)-like protein